MLSVCMPDFHDEKAMPFELDYISLEFLGDHQMFGVSPPAAAPPTRVAACSIVKKASTRTASCWPKMRVADVGTQAHCSLPGGRSRTRPWRFVTKTSHLKVGLTGVAGIALLH